VSLFWRLFQPAKIKPRPGANKLGAKVGLAQNRQTLLVRSLSNEAGLRPVALVTLSLSPLLLGATLLGLHTAQSVNNW
jgi:hypothetical protein